MTFRLFNLKLRINTLVCCMVAVALTGCEGGNGDDTTASSGGAVTPEPTPEPTSYRDSFINAGWLCDEEATACYKAEDGLLLTGNIQTGEQQAELISTSNTFRTLYQSAISSQYTVVGDCIENTTTESWALECYGVNQSATESESNIGTIDMTLGQSSTSLFALDFTPFADQYAIPVDASNSQITELLNAFYLHKDYDCNESECSRFSTTYSVGQKVLREDEIEACSLSEIACSSQSIFAWAAKQTDELWGLFPTYPDKFYPYTSSSVRYDCADELTKTDAIFCPYYSVSFDFSTDKKANAMALVELYSKSNNPDSLDDFEAKFLYSGNRKFDDLAERFQLQNILPELPERPSTVPSEYMALSKYLNNQVEKVINLDEWGNADSIQAIRKPICTTYQSIENSEVEGFDRACAVFVQNNEIYECLQNGREDFLYGGARCQPVSDYPEKIKDYIWKSGFEQHGFDYAYKVLNVEHSRAFPITVVDGGCDVDHVLVRDRLLFAAATYDDNNYAPKVLDDTPVYLMRHDRKSLDKSYSEQKAHCTQTTSIAAGMNGAYLNVFNLIQTTITDSWAYLKPSDNEILISRSMIGFGSSSYIKQVDAKSVNGFVVNGAGNQKENWSEEFSGQDMSALDNAVIVGGTLQDAKRLVYFTATPGDNSALQSRWITAVAIDNIAGTGIANTIYALEKVKGTSFATPLVSRALNLAKSYCPNMTYRELSDVMLETADRSMADYSADRWGMGALDVEAMFRKLTNDSCQAL